MARINYLQEFTKLAKKHDLRFTVNGDGTLEGIRAHSIWGKGYYPNEPVNLGSKAAYDWLKQVVDHIKSTKIVNDDVDKFVDHSQGYDYGKAFIQLTEANKWEYELSPNGDLFQVSAIGSKTSYLVRPGVRIGTRAAYDFLCMCMGAPRKLRVYKLTMGRRSLICTDLHEVIDFIKNGAEHASEGTSYTMEIMALTGPEIDALRGVKSKAIQMPDL